MLRASRRVSAQQRWPIGIMFAVAVVLAGCGSSTTVTTVDSGVVTVVVTSPASGSVIAGNSVVVRGTVTPANATVLVQGQPAPVGNGVFTGTATLHAGKTNIDVIGSAPGATPGSTSVEVVQQSQSSGSSGSSPSHHSSSSSGGATPGIARESAGAGGGGSDESSCGGSLSVGPDTTCVFAEAVESAYFGSGEADSVEAYSPVTHKNYEMTCVTNDGEVTCTGGIGAAVYFAQ